VNKKNKENISVTVKYDDGARQDMSVSDLNDDFALRYSLTIHKSQGGEYDDIILFMGTPHENSSWKQSNSKKLFYTAVSRAKKRCFIIAKKNLIMIAQSIDEEIPITTFLK
jgi:ATP-dependent exoDNAse (exonuclease V) alpha subunit